MRSWGVVCLINDLDYEQVPDQNCRETGEILREQGWSKEYIRAAISHGWGICSDIKPEIFLEKYIYAIDELTGLVVTTSLIRPSKRALDVQVKSAKPFRGGRSEKEVCNMDLQPEGRLSGQGPRHDIHCNPGDRIAHISL